MVYSTKVLKDASEILETNAISTQVRKIENDIQPTVNIQPYINVFKSTNSTGTLYTTPTDKDFYLTGITLACWGDSDEQQNNGEAVFTVILRDGTTESINIKTDNLIGATGTSLTLHIPFPMRGLLLAKGSNISVALDLGSATIQGYTGSDRSGL